MSLGSFRFPKSLFFGVCRLFLGSVGCSWGLQVIFGVCRLFLGSAGYFWVCRLFNCSDQTSFTEKSLKFCYELMFPLAVTLFP